MNALRYIDVCSGISAPTAAWKPLGWQALCYAEIEAAPCAVLAHHYPNVPLRGDFTEIKGDEYGPVDLLVGGTPCQSFSIAGLRGGLADDRGNLALEYLRLADRARPRWLVWENVPGVLSSNSGRDFGAILGGLAELGYGFAYRILDAQHFGVPQRRRRVFVVGYLGDWRCAAAVLFERHGLQGHSAPRREKGQNAPTIPSRSTGGGGLGTDFDCDGGLIAFNSREDCCSSESVFGSLGSASPQAQAVAEITPIDMRQASRGATMTNNRAAGSSGGAPGTGIGEVGDPSPTVSTSHVPAVAFSIMPMNSGKDYKARETNIAQPVMADGPVGGNQGGDYIVGAICKASFSGGASGRPEGAAAGHFLAQHASVRRLTPMECERLQGFPDDFSLVPYRGRMMADGPRYKMLGNSMAVPVMAWIGQRIARVDALFTERAAA